MLVFLYTWIDQYSSRLDSALKVWLENIIDQTALLDQEKSRQVKG